MTVLRAGMAGTLRDVQHCGAERRRRREFILRNNISNAARLALHLVVLVAAVKLKYFTACVRNVQNGNYDRSD